MKEFFKEFPIGGFILMLFVSFIVFLIIDLSFGSNLSFTGTVIDKRHQSESYRTGVSRVYTNNGTATVTTSEITPEVYQLLVRLTNGEVVKVECDATLWYTKKINESVICKSWIGYLSNTSWSDRATNQTTLSD